MASFSLKNNLTIDNNKYLNWINRDGNYRYNLIGLNTSNNLIINPPNDLMINNNSNNNVYINNAYINNSLYSNSNITILKNKYIASNTSQGTSDGFLGISSSLVTTGNSRIVLYGNDSNSSSGTIDIYSGQSTSSSLNFYNSTSCSLSISNNIINFHNINSFSSNNATIGTSVLFSNTTNSLYATSGSVVINGGIGIGGNISLHGKLLYNDTTVSTNYTTGSFVLGGGLSISNTSVASDINNGGALSIAGGVSIGKNTFIGGNVVLYNNSSTNSTSSFDANLVVYGGLGINDSVYLRSNDSQIKIAPITNNNPTTISFYQNNDYTGNNWLLGQSNGNFTINSNGSGTNGTVVSMQHISVGNIYLTGDLIGGDLLGNGSLISSNLIVDTINIGVGNMFSGSFNAANNVITPSAITNLVFSSSSVVNFTINMSVVISINSGSSSLYETFTLSGIYSSTGWILTDYSVGDISGIRFSIDSNGQIYYTSTDTTGWTSTTFRFSVSCSSITGNYPFSGSPTSGNTYIFDSLLLTNTSDALSLSSTGALSVAGGVTIQKRLNINGNVSTNNIYTTSLTSSNVSISGTISSGTYVGSLMSSGSLGATGATIGTLTTTSLTSSNISISGTISSGTYVGSLMSSGSLGATGATIGTIYATTISSSNMYVSGSVVSVNVTTLNLIDNIISSGSLIVSGNTSLGTVVISGTLSSGSIRTSNLTTSNITTSNIIATNVTNGTMNASDITTGNINITGSLYQNGVAYSSLPPGFIMQYATSTPPSGWLLCDGSAISRSTYSALFAIINTTYGSGNGTTTFNVPDLRGRVPVGYGQGSGLTNRTMASTGGEETHTLTTSEMPSHSHSINDPGHYHSYAYYYPVGTQVSNVNGTNAGGTNYTNNTNSATTNITINNAGSGAAHNTMPPYIVVNYLIKT